MVVLPLDALKGSRYFFLTLSSGHWLNTSFVSISHLRPSPWGWRNRLESDRPMVGNKPTLRHSFKPQRTDLVDDCPGGCMTALGVGGPPQVMEWAPECAATLPIMFITQGQGLLCVWPYGSLGLLTFLRLGRLSVSPQAKPHEAVVSCTWAAA